MADTEASPGAAAARVFISHKHSDKRIAEAIATFIKRTTANQVVVFDSSSSAFESPRMGKNVNTELKEALARSDVVLLVYTAAGDDWQYCMWECGVATDPRDEHLTSVVVLKCGTVEAPKPFADTLVVDARDEDAVIAFTKQFLTGPTFFPRLGKQVSSYNAEEAILDEIGRELHKVLTEVVPAPQAGKETDLVATSYLRIELPPDDVAAILATPDTDRLALAATSLAERGFVVESELARSLFAIKVDSSTTLGRIRDSWASEFPNSAPLWFDSIAKQVKMAITDNYPDDVPWAPYRTSVERSYIPVVSRSRAMPSGGMQFDLYFVAIGPAPVPVSTRMIPIDNAFHKRLGTTSASAILLGDLVAEMEEEGRSRVPVLAEDGGVKYIVHRSMIDQFVAQQALRGNDVKVLSLEQLLEDPHFASIFAESFTIVPPNITLEEAKAKMAETNHAQDVLVTVDGTPETRVVGWLTNTMFV
ncbi:MAG: toll/interleukin-1 receptor domain-containing protein [Ilumatobacteraceae bacterium]